MSADPCAALKSKGQADDISPNGSPGAVAAAPGHEDTAMNMSFRRCWWNRAAVAAGAVAVAVGLSAPAGAQPPSCPSPGVLSGNACRFVFGVGSGAPQTVSIPAGVKMTVFAAGAPGASGEWLNGFPWGVGGAGGTEQGTFTVGAPKTLTVIVGDSGTQSFSGGCAYPPVRTMGAGGGGSFVFDGVTPLVIAGGGGGAASCTSQSSCAGGDGGAGGDATGGTAGQDGLVNTGQGGHGGGAGTPSAGGGGGAAGDVVGQAGQAEPGRSTARATRIWPCRVTRMARSAVAAGPW